jgi:Chaperone of endosialidase
MEQARDIRNITLGAVVAASGLSALAAVNLTTFTPNTPIKSFEVNANFSSLKANIEALQAPVGVSRLAIAGSAADGKVLKLQAGNLAWADDLTGGTGGAAYSAGTGLSLTGTTFSLADGGVTLNALSATGGTDGKVLKILGGKLTWADDIVGSPGSTYSADDSSLVLTGTKFSVKEGGVSTAKIADGAVTNGKLATGAVTGSKMALPLSLKNTDDGTLGLGLLVDLGNVPGGGVHLGRAILGRSNNGVGVSGESQKNAGVVGTSVNSDGVVGFSEVSRGVFGFSTSGRGVSGQSTSEVGVYGNSIDGSALFGENNNNATTLRLHQGGNGALIDAIGAGGVTVFSVDRKGNVFSGTNSYSSDRNLKTNVQNLNAQKVLEQVAMMPMTRWNYKRDASTVQHIGPMAQDFHAAFGLNGNDGTHINAVDANGVAFAAIKGMYEKNRALEHQVETLEARLSALEKTARSR